MHAKVGTNNAESATALSDEKNGINSEDKRRIELQRAHSILVIFMQRTLRPIELESNIAATQRTQGQPTQNQRAVDPQSFNARLVAESGDNTRSGTEVATIYCNHTGESDIFFAREPRTMVHWWCMHNEPTRRPILIAGADVYGRVNCVNNRSANNRHFDSFKIV
tara:strand:- start:73 stop:567 length:495 start_codon:yes stop_codon:yes gene_type:complete